MAAEWQRPVGASGRLGAEHEDPAVLRSPHERRRASAAHRRKVDRQLAAGDGRSVRAGAQIHVGHRTHIGNQDCSSAPISARRVVTRLDVPRTFEVDDGDDGTGFASVRDGGSPLLLTTPDRTSPGIDHDNQPNVNRIFSFRWRSLWPPPDVRRSWPRSARRPVKQPDWAALEREAEIKSGLTRPELGPSPR